MLLYADDKTLAATAEGPHRGVRHAPQGLIGTGQGARRRSKDGIELRWTSVSKRHVVSAADDLIERIRSRLLATPQAAEDTATLVPDWTPEGGFRPPPRDAAVLIALVRRAERFSVLYTERSPVLRSHSGQMAFPGGKIDPTDEGPADAALREAHEEVALEREDARVLGYLPAYFTGTNYLITPVVAEVTAEPCLRRQSGRGEDGVRGAAGNADARGKFWHVSHPAQRRGADELADRP